MSIEQAAVETESKQIVTPSLPVLISEIEEHINEGGWSVVYEGNDFPQLVGICYIATLTRAVEAPSETPVKPPVDRAAIMAKARAARGNKEVA